MFSQSKQDLLNVLVHLGQDVSLVVGIELQLESGSLLDQHHVLVEMTSLYLDFVYFELFLQELYQYDFGPSSRALVQHQVSAHD